MSNRGFATATFAAWVVAMIGNAVLAESDATPDHAVASSAPAASIVRAASKPATDEGTLSVGAVQRALERLYTFPRPTTQPAVGSGRRERDALDPGRLGLQHNDSIRDSASSVPIGGRTLEHRIGMQHADTIQHSASSVPIGERDRAPNPDSPVTNTSALVPNELSAAPTRVSVVPYPYYTPDARFRSDRLAVGGSRGFGFHDSYYDRRFERTSNERGERILTRSRGHLERGLQHFHDGRYDAAADAFRLAAETNQGDPAARLYAAHALFATGRYRDAITYLRRAFELQPKIVYLDFDIRDDYGRRTDFDKQVKALEDALERAPRNGDRLILLGYVRYYSNQRGQAYELLARAKRLDPTDSLAARLLENCHPPDVVMDELQASQKQAPAYSPSQGTPVNSQ